MSNKILKISGTIMAFFGLFTLLMSTSLMFDLFGMRAKEGNYIPFVMYANFICSFIYLFSAYGFFTKNKWTTVVLFIALGILIAAYISLIFHLQSGSVIEINTILTLLFRFFLTIVFSGISWFYITRTNLLNT